MSLPYAGQLGGTREYVIAPTSMSRMPSGAQLAGTPAKNMLSVCCWLLLTGRAVPPAGRPPRRLQQRGSETQGLLPRSVNSDRRPRPRSRRVGRAGVHVVGAGDRS